MNHNLIAISYLDRIGMARLLRSCRAIFVLMTLPLLGLPVPVSAEQYSASPPGFTSPLQIEEAKLQASSDKARYYVIRSVFSETTLTEATFRRMSPDRKSELTSEAFYFACLGVANESPWEPDLLSILQKVLAEVPLKDVILEFEREYYSKYHSWPSILGVDVDSVNRRIVNSIIVR